MIGPYTTIDVGQGRGVDLYLLRFDKEGRLLSPRTQQALLDIVHRHSDVFVFSHGWNNTFDTARDKYVEFVRGYAAQRTRLGLGFPRDYAPLLIGIIWPSTSFVLPWEAGPRIAGGPQDAEREEMLRLLGDELGADDFARLTELVDGVASLGTDEATAAARLVLTALTPGGDPEDAASPPTAEELVRAWAALGGAQAAEQPRSPDDFGAVDQPAGTDPGTGPTAAGRVRLDPRDLLRTTTVWLMKDRAGAVGAGGVARLLQHLLDDSSARVHLVGHSFGGRVLLSAATLQGSRRKIHSLLLLQAAVNRWCFADAVVGRGIPGGYRPVLDRVERPVLTTYSRHDVPLHEAFHLALRGSHLGEPKIAAIGDPDRYGALGGYGPKGIEDRLVTRKAVPEGTSYDLDGVTGVVQIDGDVSGARTAGIDPGADGPAIAGHGDISTTVTWWALHSLTG